MSRAVLKTKVLQNAQILLPAISAFKMSSRAFLLEEGSQGSSIISGPIAFCLILNGGFLPAVFGFSKISVNPVLKFQNASTWKA